MRFAHGRTVVMAKGHRRDRGAPIVVDGSNIAYLETASDGKPTVGAIERVRARLEEMGYRPIIIVDAALWHQVDDPDRLNALIEKGIVHQAPAGTDADVFVLETARSEHTKIVTDDRYRDHEDRFPHPEEMRSPVMIVDGMVEFYELQPAGNRVAR